MVRKIVKIDEDKCTGCGLCVPSCEEGAIEIVDGKARIVSEVYCDGLGACLGECPEDAISIEERDAAPFDEAAAFRHVAAKKEEKPDLPSGCPGTLARELKRGPETAPCTSDAGPVRSELRNWPVQLKLAPTNAPCFQGADLLLAADCVPFALADFHRSLLREKPVVIGCPKLDDPDFYVEKLTDLIRQSSVRSITLVHMEVPCCSGLVRIAETAIAASGTDVPMNNVTVGIQGEIIADVCAT